MGMLLSSSRGGVSGDDLTRFVDSDVANCFLVDDDESTRLGVLIADVALLLVLELVKLNGDASNCRSPPSSLPLRCFCFCFFRLFLLVFFDDEKQFRLPNRPIPAAAAAAAFKVIILISGCEG